MVTLEQVTKIITHAIDTDEEIDAHQFDRIVARSVLHDVFPLICNDLRREILQAHRGCSVWNDETSNVRECTHLEDIQIIRGYVTRMKGL